MEKKCLDVLSDVQMSNTVFDAVKRYVQFLKDHPEHWEWLKRKVES